MSLQHKFVIATGLHNVFNTSSATELDLSSIKNDVSTRVSSESIIFFTADASDASYGFLEGEKYIWAENAIYYTNENEVPIIDKTNDQNTSFAIDPNKMYMFGTRSTLTISFNDGKPNIMNEYMFLFTSGSTPTVLTMPNGVRWIKEPIVISANKKYSVSVENNLGILSEWPTGNN